MVHEALGVQCLREHLRQFLRLGDPERVLDTFHRRLLVAAEVVDTRGLGGQHGDVGIGVVGGEQRECGLEEGDRFLGTAEVPERTAHLSCRARCVVGPVPGLVELPRLIQALERHLALVAVLREHAGAFDERRPLQRVARERTGLIECSAGVLHRRERGRPLARARQPLEGACLDLLGVVRRLVGPECVEVVSGDHLRDLVGLDPRLLREIDGGAQVLRLPVVSRKGLVGDPLDQRLEEAVLPALG